MDLDWNAFSNGLFAAAMTVVWVVALGIYVWEKV